MTATAPSAEATQMAHTPDPPAAPPAALETAEAAAGAGGRRWAVLGDHPIQTGFATLAVALLVFSFASIGNRIDDVHGRIDDVHGRIDRLEDTMNTRFAEQDAKIDKLDTKIDALDAKIDEINLKLTALIAALNKTGEVDAAVRGSLLP